MSIKHNIPQVAQRIEAKGPAVEREVMGALDKEGQLMARAMQREAPKFQSTLVNSISVDSPTPMERVIAPGVDYATWVHTGRKPGKGLPAYFDPAAKPMQDWIEQIAGGGPRKRERQSHEQALRDIYEGMSWHIRAYGIKANPFAQRAFDARVNNVASALRVAVARGLQAGGGAA